MPSLKNLMAQNLSCFFFSITLDLELESVWLMKPGNGPVENFVSIKNNSGNSITFKDADIISANINISLDSAESLCRFNKSRYLGRKYKNDKPIVNIRKIRTNDTKSYFLSNDEI